MESTWKGKSCDVFVVGTSVGGAATGPVVAPDEVPRTDGTWPFCAATSSAAASV